jgi:hypothetical protein
MEVKGKDDPLIVGEAIQKNSLRRRLIRTVVIFWQMWVIDVICPIF